MSIGKTMLLASFAFAMSLASPDASAQFPSRPITLIVPFGAGGSTDITSRALGDAVGRLLGERVIVENRPGGSGATAIASFRQRPADGHTVLIMGSTQIANQYMNDVPYNVQRDFRPLAIHMFYNAGLVVRADSPWKTFQEFFAHAKANPGKVSYSSSAAGAPQHLVMERLANEQGLDLTFVPYGDGMKAVLAVMGGHVTASSQVTEWKPLVLNGDLRLLVTYGDKRMSQFPDVPTLKELYGISTLGFNSLVVAKDTPQDLFDKLDKAFQTVLQDKDSEFAKLVVRYDLLPETMNAPEAAAYFKSFDEQARKLLGATQIKN